MSFTITLGTALTATTNPDPNTYTYPNPYFGAFTDLYTPCTTWAAASHRAFVPKPNLGRSDKDSPRNLYVGVKTSTSGATLTVTMWVYNRLAAKWQQPKNTPAISLGANDRYIEIEDPPRDAIALQLSSISAGSVSLYLDGNTARRI